METKKLLNNDSFCVLPWMHLYKNMDNSVKLCCVDKGSPIGSLSENSVEEIRNSQEFSKLRKSFLDGERLDRCTECWSWEKNGYQSYRQSSNKDYIDQLPEHIFEDEPLEITYLDYRPSNLCNLACKICSPRFSSKLIDPWLQVGQIKPEEVAELTKFNVNRVDVETVKKDFTHINNIYFAGGEPLIADDHWNLLEHFSQYNPKEIKIKYNTNLTKLDFKGKKVEDYWGKFGKIQIGASLDGYGKQFEHLRTGASWDVVISNLQRIKKLSDKIQIELKAQYGEHIRNKGIDIYCDATVGWLNLKSVFKLHKFLYENKYIVLDDPNYYKLLAKPLNFPYGASLACTPPELKPELIESVEEHKEWVKSVYEFDTTTGISDLDSLISNINSSNYDEDKIREWLAISIHLDTKYKLHTPTAFQFKSEIWNSKFLELYNNKSI